MLEKFAQRHEDCVLFASPQHASQCRDFMRAMKQRESPGSPTLPVRIVRFSVLAHPTQDSTTVRVPDPSDATIRLYIVLFLSLIHI